MSRKRYRAKKPAQAPVRESSSDRSGSGAPIRKGTNAKRNIVREFDEYFGSASVLENWQRLCQNVGIEEELSSIKKCRKALSSVWVNIYDLLDAKNLNAFPPRRFGSRNALVKYTLRTRRIYPKDEAKEGGPVKALLTHIFQNER